MEPEKKRIPITHGDLSNNIPLPPTPGGDTQNRPASDHHPVAALQQQLALQQEECLRLRAEFDLFIKRTQRDAKQQAGEEKEAFIRDFLPIFDHLERALGSERLDSCEPLHRGVRITMQEVSRLLQRHGIEPVEDVGQPFDPRRHEAVFVQQDPLQPDRIVLKVTQRGYCQGDKVFRPAQVVVNDLSRSPGASHGR